MEIGLGGAIGQAVLTKSEKKELLDSTAPKIIDREKFYGPAADDFEAIKKRMKELEGG